MKISHKVYENLKPMQRVIATIEAQSRNDKDEIRRLVKSCPKKTYTQNDANVVDVIDRLHAMAVGLECDLRGLTIAYMLADRRKPELTEPILRKMSLIYQAWELAIEETGLNLEILQKAIRVSNPYVECLCEMAFETDQDKIIQMKDALVAFILHGTPTEFEF